MSEQTRRRRWEEKSIFIIQVTVTANKKLCISSMPQNFLHFPSSPFRRRAHSVHVCFIIAFTMYNFIRLFSEFHIKHFSNLRIGVFQLQKHMGRPDYFQMHLASSRVGVRTDVDVNYLFLFSSGSHTELSRHLFFIPLSVKCLRGRFANEVTSSRLYLTRWHAIRHRAALSCERLLIST